LLAEDKARATKLRGETLKSIEEGRGENAEVAQVVADAIVGCHLRTMARLDIGYELLARESEILHLKFWDAAFEMLKKSGAIQLATSGKMAGCWIMPWEEEVKEVQEVKTVKEVKEKTPEQEEENSQAKIIVRSNGTVTYVGKDIAYQLWKFGLLGKDFHYRKWPNAPRAEVQQRHAEMRAEEQELTAQAIAVGALRFFLLKFTRNAIIAFDFKDALSFEGETGPYCQYAVVRIRGIRRKGAEAGATNVDVTRESVSQLLSGAEGDSLWELLVAGGSLDYAVDAAIATQEPSFMAKYAFQLAQAFNNFYHKHHILSEADGQKRAFLLRLTELVEAQMV